MKKTQYCIAEKKNWAGVWITAPDAMLLKTEIFPECSIADAKWIWPVPYVRTHLRKDFVVSENIKSVKVELYCDNSFDLYLNGKYVLLSAGKADVTQLIEQGCNKIGVRLFQTSDPNHFTSAIRGGLEVVCQNGQKIYIPTDESWKAFVVCDFGQGIEPADWSVADYPGKACKGKQWDIICTIVHPRLRRRSCYFRKNVIVADNVKKAILRCTARGLYEIFINGEKVSNSYFQPGSTERYCEYQEYDVTSLMHEGQNAIATVLGNGWLNCESWGSLWANKPALLAELVITDDAGKEQIMGTDSTWKCTPSPITDNDIQFGERVDGRLEIPEWNTENLCDKAWLNAEEMPDVAKGLPIVLQEHSPVTLQEEITPISCEKWEDGWLFDLGKNISGRAQIHIHNATAGQQVIISYYERFSPNGTLCDGPYTDVFFEQDNISTGKACWAMRNTDVYICSGEDEEVYTPRFTYTGGRYILVRGYPGKPECSDICFRRFCNDLNVTGIIETPNSVINQIWDMARRTYRNNLMTAPTDCPTREKNFWNGDMQVFVDTACWYMDHSKFLARWTDAGRKIEYGVYGWEDEEYILPWALYRFYGDEEILKVKYPVIRHLIMERQQIVRDGLPLGAHAPYRDHLATVNVPSDFYASCFYCRMLDTSAKIADVIGEETDAKQYREWLAIAKTAFQKKYYLPEENDYAPHCQGGLVLPLAFDIVTKEQRIAVGQKLAQYVQADGYHPTTGYGASSYLLPLLCDFGYTDLAWKTFSQESYPSWRHIFATGATSFTENWHGMDATGFTDSMDHYALGNVCSWFFTHLAGIQQLPGISAFQKFALKPFFMSEVGRFGVQFHSANGEIKSAWTFEDGTIVWNFTIPEGTTAVVYLMDREPKEYESGNYQLIIDAHTM